MAVDEHMRHEVHRSFAELWDEDRAAAVMVMMSPDLSNLATKDELEAGLAGVRGEVSGLRGEVSGLRGEVEESRVDFRLFQQKTLDEFRVLRGELREQEQRLAARFEESLRKAITSQSRTIVLSMLALVVTMFASVVGLVGLLVPHLA
jgi:hypothetical protein